MTPPRRFRRLNAAACRERGEEPLREIRKCLTQLGANEGLMVLAPFLPSPLIELLRSEGYESKLERGQNGEWRVSFWRPGEVE